MISGLVFINMVVSEFYESFLLSKSGNLENASRENTRFSQASTIFKNIKTQIEDARKMLRNKKVLMFRKSSFLPNPLAFQAPEIENDDEFTLKYKFFIILKGIIHNKWLKKFFSLCALLNIILICYDFVDLPGNSQILNDIDLSFSFVFMLEFFSAVVFYGPIRYLKKTHIKNWI